jgi:thiol-disulfide isomerase/thioredoxin
MLSPTLTYVLAAVMAVVGLGFIYIIVRPNDKPLPQGAVQWTGAVMSLLLVGLAVALSVLTYQVDRREDLGEFPPLVGTTEAQEEAENFSFYLLPGGKEVELEDYEGQVVLLNFWATWCPPCLNELPALNQLYADYADEGLAVITLSDEDPATIEDFAAEEIGLETISGYISDPEALPQPFIRMLTGRPMTYIIDREGVVRNIILGERDYASFEMMVGPLLLQEVAAAESIRSYD